MTVNIKFLIFALSFFLIVFCTKLHTQTQESTNKEEMMYNAWPKASLPLILGHRGACGYRPEHTLVSYELAIEMGADYIEPDLVSTKDRILICRHENEISGTTDVAEKFPDRKAKKVIDGCEVTGYFTEDFTLAEIKTLRVRERLPFRDQKYNGLYQIPTFREFIDLVQKKKNNRSIGIYPETKHSTYFASLGLSLEEPLVEILTENGYTGKNAPVFIQSFEIDNLKKLSKQIDIRLIQLLGKPHAKPGCVLARGANVTYFDMATAPCLKEIAQYAYGIGVSKEFIMATGTDSLIENAHTAGLKVHIYTLRNEPFFLPKEFKHPIEEYYMWFRLGVDGIFTDFPDTGVEARKSFYKK